MSILLVFAGGMIGASTRYLLDRFVQERHSGVFPWGTLAVNLLGSVILGALIGAGMRAHVPRELTVSVGTGLCGALTTFSTLGYETIRLLENGSAIKATLNAAGSLTLGVLAAIGSHAAALAVF